MTILSFPAHKPPARTELFCGALMFAIIFQLQYNYAINAFYYYGTPYYDAGAIASQLWHNSWDLIIPGPVDDRIGVSFFSIHLTFLMALLSQVSAFIPTHAQEYYACFLASVYGGLALAMLWALSICVRPHDRWQQALTLLLAAAFAFNGVIMSGVWIMHYEYPIPLGMILFLVAEATGRKRWALFFFVMTLAVREDAGLHLACMLGALIMARVLQTRSLSSARREIIFLAAALCYSACAFGLIGYFQRHYHMYSTFAAVYSGEDTGFFSHVTWALVRQRLGGMFYEKFYLWTSCIVILIGAVKWRNSFLAAGIAANLPWLIINLLGASDSSGEMDSYYAFPFAVTMGWPVIAAVWQYKGRVPSAQIRQALILQVCVALMGLLAWNKDTNRLEPVTQYYMRWGSFYPHTSAETVERTQEFVKILRDDNQPLGNVLADEVIFGFSAKTGTPIVLLDSSYDDFAADTLIYFKQTFPDEEDDILNAVDDNGLSYHYCVPATQICLFSRYPRSELGAYAGWLTETPPPVKSAEEKRGHSKIAH